MFKITGNELDFDLFDVEKNQKWKIIILIWKFSFLNIFFIIIFHGDAFYDLDDSKDNSLI